MNPLTEDVLLAALSLFALLFVVKTLADHFTHRRLISSRMSDEAIRDLQVWMRESGRHGSLKWGLVWVGLGLGLVITDVLPIQVGSALSYGILLVSGGAGLLGHYAITSLPEKRK